MLFEWAVGFYPVADPPTMPRAMPVVVMAAGTRRETHAYISLGDGKLKTLQDG